MDGVRIELTGEFNLAELKDFERAEPILPKGVARTEANDVTLNKNNLNKLRYFLSIKIFFSKLYVVVEVLLTIVFS